MKVDYKLSTQKKGNYTSEDGFNYAITATISADEVMEKIEVIITKHGAYIGRIGAENGHLVINLPMDESRDKHLAVFDELAEMEEKEIEGEETKEEEEEDEEWENTTSTQRKR